MHKGVENTLHLLLCKNLGFKVLVVHYMGTYGIQCHRPNQNLRYIGCLRRILLQYATPCQFLSGTTYPR